VNWFDITAQLKGEVKAVPVVSYCEHSVGLIGHPCAHTPAPLRELSAGPSNEAPPMPDVEEQEEAAPEAPCKPPANKDNDDDLYVQPQAWLACHLALDGVAELPTDV
jgi:hypothetical protein